MRLGGEVHNEASSPSLSTVPVERSHPVRGLLYGIPSAGSPNSPSRTSTPARPGSRSGSATSQRPCPSRRTPSSTNTATPARRAAPAAGPRRPRRLLPRRRHGSGRRMSRPRHGSSRKGGTPRVHRESVGCGVLGENFPGAHRQGFGIPRHRESEGVRGACGGGDHRGSCRARRWPSSTRSSVHRRRPRPGVVVGDPGGVRPGQQTRGASPAGSSCLDRRRTSPAPRSRPAHPLRDRAPLARHRRPLRRPAGTVITRRQWHAARHVSGGIARTSAFRGTSKVLSWKNANSLHSRRSRRRRSPRPAV